MAHEQTTTTGARLLAALEPKMFVTPTLRRVILNLPERATPGSDQVDAVVALVVLNAWICLSDAALDLLRDVDAATDGVLGLYPRDVRLAVAARADVERAHAAATRLATKLGFSPGHRTKVAQVVQDCARSVLATGTGHLALHVLLGSRRGLAVEARVEAPHARDDARVGSAPWLSPLHVRQIADEFEAQGPPAGPLHIRAAFYVGGRGALA